MNKDVEKYLEKIKEEVEQELIKEGAMTIKNGERIALPGSCNLRWKLEKKLLKERYNIDWKSPADENPGMKFD